MRQNDVIERSFRLRAVSLYQLAELHDHRCNQLIILTLKPHELLSFSRLTLFIRSLIQNVTVTSKKRLESEIN
jgi:hypothetical protein